MPNIPRQLVKWSLKKISRERRTSFKVIFISLFWASYVIHITNLIIDFKHNHRFLSCTCYETIWISLRSTSLTRTHTMFHVALIQNMLILQNMLTVHNVYLLNENQHFYDVCTALLQYILCYSDINTCISIQKEKKIVMFFVVT